MSKMLSVYVVGNGDLYAAYFNAIVRSFGTDAYHRWVHVSLVIGGFSALGSYVMKRSILDLVKWFGFAYVCIYILFMPQRSIEIIDVLNGNKPYAVDNVPLGVAMLAHFTSTLSYSLTQLTEENFSTPDDLHYSKTGMVFASELVRSASQFEITDATFDKNLQNYIHQCVFYDILLNKYSLDELVNSPDIWSKITRQASPARGFVYTSKDGSNEFHTCKESIANLTSDFKTAIDVAANQYGGRIFSKSPNPGAELKKYLGISYGYLTKLSQEGSRIMQQNLIANAIQRGVISMGANVDANAALQSYAFARAQEQKRLTNQTVGEMAAVWLPLIKNAIELITYGTFIFVILLALLPFGPSVVKSFIYTLVWVHLWPPLYAIINLTISFYGQAKSVAASSNGLSMQNLSGLLQVNSDMAGLAGYLSMSVPVIAGGLIWGMHHAFLQASQYAGGVAQSTAATGAAEAVTGNLGFGNTNFSNQSAFNTTANHTDTNARIASGGMSMQLADGSQLSIMPDGTQVLNTSGTISNIGTTIGFSQSLRTSYAENADKSYTAAQNYNAAYNESTGAALRGIYEIGEHYGKSEASGEGWNISASSGTTKAIGEVMRITQAYADRHHISFNEAANVLSSAYADAKAGLNAHAGLSAKSPGSGALSAVGASSASADIGAGVSLGANIGLSRTAGHNNSTDRGRQFSDAQDFIKDTNYTENVDLISRATQDKSLRINNEEGARVVNNVGSSFEKASSMRKEMSESLQQADSYRLQAQRVEDDAIRIDTVGNQEFYEYIASQPGTNGHGTLGPDSVKHILDDPVTRQHYVSGFVEQYKHKIEQNWQHGLAHSENDIEARHHSNSQALAKQDHIDASRKAYDSDINAKSGQHGLTQNSMIDHSIKHQTENMIANNAVDLDKRNRNLDFTSRKLKNDIEEEGLKKHHGSLLKDIVNNIDTQQIEPQEKV